MNTSQYDNLPKRRNNDLGPEAIGLGEDRRSYMKVEWWKPLGIFMGTGILCYLITKVFN